MDKLFGRIPDFKKHGDCPLHVSIGRHLENLIREGHLKHRQRLPTTQEMARSFNVTIATIQQSLAALNEKGLVKRSPRIGTYVNSESVPGNIAIVFGSDPLQMESLCYRKLLSCFDSIGAREGLSISCHFAIGGNAFESQSKMLKEDVKNGRYACIVPVAANKELVAWLESQNEVPWIWPSGCDTSENVRMGLSHLLERGYRRIALVSTCDPAREDSCALAGLEYQGAWAAYLSKGIPLPQNIIRYWGAAEADAYRKGLELLSSPERPDAIFINHDVLTNGFLKAASELGVRVPGDIALLTHSNKGIDYEWPPGIARLEVDPEETVASTLAYVKDNFLGVKRPSQKSCYGKVPYKTIARLIPGEPC